MLGQRRGRVGMELTFSELKKRELICMDTGDRLGMVDDILLEENCVKALLTYGVRPKFLFVRSGKPKQIPWERIRLLGKDFAVVDSMEDLPFEPNRPRKKKFSSLVEQLFQ